MSEPPRLPQVVERYPSEYTFRVVARHVPDVTERVRLIVRGVVGELDVTVVTNRASAASNYLSLHVTCTLVSEEQRRDVYVRLKADPHVMMML